MMVTSAVHQLHLSDNCCDDRHIISDAVFSHIIFVLDKDVYISSICPALCGKVGYTLSGRRAGLHALLVMTR